MKSLIKVNQLWYLTSALFRELVREPGVLFWGILFPILMSLGLGLAFTRKNDQTRKVAIVNDETHSIIRNFLDTKCIAAEPGSENDWNWKYTIEDDKLGNSIFLFYKMTWDEGIVMLKRGTVNVLISSTPDSVSYNFDPMNGDAELTYLKLKSAISNENVTNVTGNNIIRPLTVRGTRYIDFLVPGLVTLGVMMSCMWGISYGIIEKRSKKLLRRLVATPMRKSHFLVALITVRVLMNFIESAILIVFSVLAFRMTIQGDLTALVMLYLAGNIAFSGIAILVSSHTSNTEVGNGLINFVVTPMMVLSGIFFSYQNFPEWSMPVIENLPLTMFTDGIRSIFNEGAGLAEVAIPAAILSATGALFFVAGLKIFKWH